MSCVMRQVPGGRRQASRRGIFEEKMFRFDWNRVQKVIKNGGEDGVVLFLKKQKRINFGGGGRNL